MVSFPRIIDMGDFRLVKLEPTAQNAERLLSVINANREFLGEFLEWVDGYTTTDKTLANIEKSYGDDKCAYFIMVDGEIAGKIGFVDTDNNMGEISYWLAHGFNGRGIMTRALNKLTEMGGVCQYGSATHTIDPGQTEYSFGCGCAAL